MTLPVAPAPDGTLATDVKRGNPDWPEKGWIRWNDYGIGLLLQGDLRGASAAFTKVAEIAKDKPDGPLNLARAKIRRATFPPRRSPSPRPRRRRPGWRKTASSARSSPRKKAGLTTRSPTSSASTAKFPKDRVVLNQRARVLYLAGRYADALPFIDRVLAIDGEDLAAHYNAMLCLKALGRAEEAAAEEKWYRFFKEDEGSRAVLAEYRRTHPYDNRESLPIHVHDEPVPAKAEEPPWIAEIGPKGYAYKGAVPPNEMVLHDDRPAGAPRPFARPETPKTAAGQKTAKAVPVAAIQIPE